jgi:hypothetical protein
VIRAELVPERIVLSRKGFDSAAGGCASPILDGEMISLPIPEHNSSRRVALGNGCCPEKHLTYHDLTSTQGKKVAELATQLTKRKIKATDCVHLDPDIRPELRAVNNRNLPLTFGQDSGSQTELKDLQEGDLFLFFGWFRDACEFSPGSFRFAADRPDVHAIWGWLQIAERLDLPSKLARAKEIAGHHPHVSYPADKNPNCLYVAGETLSFFPKYAGAGVFSKFHDGLPLSDRQETRRSYWRLPAFFKNESMHVTHIPHLSEWNLSDDRESILGRAAYCPGQEFVFETKGYKTEIAKWLDGIFAEGNGVFS